VSQCGDASARTIDDRDRRRRRQSDSHHGSSFGDEDVFSQHISEIVSADLNRSGRFKLQDIGNVSHFDRTV
jgi:hypothetical protein